MRIAIGKSVTLMQEDFGVNRKATLSVNECYNSVTFKTYSELSEIIPMNEGAYLLLKRIIQTNYSKKGNTVYQLLTNMSLTGTLKTS